MCIIEIEKMNLIFNEMNNFLIFYYLIFKYYIYFLYLLKIILKNQ